MSEHMDENQEIETFVEWAQGQLPEPEPMPPEVAEALIGATRIENRRSRWRQELAVAGAVALALLVYLPVSPVTWALALAGAVSYAAFASRLMDATPQT